VRGVHEVAKHDRELPSFRVGGPEQRGGGERLEGRLGREVEACRGRREAGGGGGAWSRTSTGATRRYPCPRTVRTYWCGGRRSPSALRTSMMYVLSPTSPTGHAAPRGRPAPGTLWGVAAPGLRRGKAHSAAYRGGRRQRDSA
jgi:hypothetical protein